ncbi:glycoside hydrolase family 16 protein, partial [Salmonella enterica]|uniref:glycoside hydrolase family 16 protein n=1 Tax=Salmonella enterica TaxID=28901 RepID=UPI0020C520F4
KGYSLVWNDEFNTGSAPDLNKWTYQEAQPGWVNNELQTYVREKTPTGTKVADIKDGKLRIKCFKEDGKIYSARIYGNVRTGWTY